MGISEALGANVTEISHGNSWSYFLLNSVLLETHMLCIFVVKKIHQ